MQENGPHLFFSGKQRITHVESKVKLRRKEFSSYRFCIHSILRIWKKEKNKFVVSVVMGLFFWPCASLCCTTSTRCNFCVGGSVAIPLNSQILLDSSSWAFTDMLLFFSPFSPTASPGTRGQAGRCTAVPGEPGQNWSCPEIFRLSHLGGSCSRSKCEDKHLLQSMSSLHPAYLWAWDETFSVEHMQDRG